MLKCSWPCGFALFTAKQDHHIHMYQVFMLKISFFLLNCSNFSVVDFSHFWVTVQILHGCNDFTVINVDKNPTYWWRNMFMFLSTQPNLKDDTTWSRKVEHRMILKKKILTDDSMLCWPLKKQIACIHSISSEGTCKAYS